MSQEVTAKKRKRSVADITEFYPPARILEIARKAYFEESINDDDRLAHCAAVCVDYDGGFRVNEGLSLWKHQFKKALSLEKREFVVMNAVVVEKTGGKMRNSPLYLRDPNDPKNPTGFRDPIAIPILAHLERLPDDAKLFEFTDRTVLNILYRTTNREAWTHWLRAQRNTFLASVFTKDERNKILGWSRGQRPDQKARRSRDMADLYEFMNWMSYADRLAKLTESYWTGETLPPQTKEWLDSLAKNLTL